MAGNANHCSFVLLAEFDIDRGAQLTYQFPQPLGTDEGLLANLMLPDGAEKQLEDWTIFFLNQTPFNTIAPVLALETPETSPQESGDGGDKPELLYVLNLVRTKHDKTVRRGAVVKAMAICTRHPFIQIFKPVLLMALDDYFSDPSQDCLARLFDAINSMDLSAAPILTRQEKIVMRSSERKDVFAEKVSRAGDNSHSSWNIPSAGSNIKSQLGHRSTPSGESYSSFEEGILMRNRQREREREVGQDRESEQGGKGRERSGSVSSHVQQQQEPQRPSQNQMSPSEPSFSLGGSAVWVGDESGFDNSTIGVASSAASSVGSSTLASSAIRGRTSLDASSSSSHTKDQNHAVTPPAVPQEQQYHPGLTKDTHFFHTSIAYKGHRLPIKMPLSTFPEEVGDYSLITLIQALPASSVTVTGPLHPHIHTNGTMTHPIIILFNALVTGKRIIFLGHNRPAGQVCSYVLSACALGSGCGSILRGFIERAFPYANLTNRDEWESVPAYIAGVTNPIFESSGSWDLLFDVGSARVIISKDIHINHPPSSNAAPTAALLLRSGTLKAESSQTSEEDTGRPVTRDGKEGGQKSEFTAKADNADNLFIEDIITAISYHFGEGLVRMRFAEYVGRFVRLAARYEEDYLGSTKLSYSKRYFTDGPHPQLGSGIVFSDETSGVRELAINASRIEGWRRSKTYQYCQVDFNKSLSTNAIRGFDVLHQLFRLRQSRNLPDAEVELIMRTIADNVQTYDQVVELLAYVVPHGGGLLHLSFGLFHQQESVRETTVDIFNELRNYPVGVLFLQTLNHFQRYAYVRQAYARETRLLREQQHLGVPHSYTSRTPSNRSESSLAG